MADAMRKADSQMSGTSSFRRSSSSVSSKVGAENSVPGLSNQGKFSKQALSFMSMGSGNFVAPNSVGGSSTLRDITNLFCTNRAMQSKATKAASSYFQAKEQPPVVIELRAPFESEDSVLPVQSVSSVYDVVFENDHKDLYLCAEYAPDIFDKYFQEERAKMPDAACVEVQQEVNPRMRGILVDWLLEVHVKKGMQPQTLYLTINIIDRYLSVVQVKRRQLQLLGVVALFIASKYEEIDPAKATELAYLTDHAYSKNEILQEECKVLTALNCEVMVVTPASFLDRLTRVNDCPAPHRALVAYLVELSLTEAHMIRQTPSALVSAAILLSNDLLDLWPRWSPTMAHHSRHEEVELRPLAEEMHQLLDKAPTATLQAARVKYQKDIRHCVADLACCRPRA